MWIKSEIKRKYTMTCNTTIQQISITEEICVDLSVKCPVSSFFCVFFHLFVVLILGVFNFTELAITSYSNSWIQLVNMKLFSTSHSLWGSDFFHFRSLTSIFSLIFSCYTILANIAAWQGLRNDNSTTSATLTYYYSIPTLFNSNSIQCFPFRCSHH